jgi:2-polyprenyl-6-methoxyphenol hydroxylase-like FAD-dependent oxidoreductase
MKVVIAGAGVGGLTAALSLHEVGIDVHLFEQAQSLAELGVGFNVLPHAVKELAALGLLPELDRVGIRTRELMYANRFGQPVWRELRGVAAGYDVPQLSIHRGKLHGVLVRAARERLGSARIHTGCSLFDFEDTGDRVTARFERRDTRDVLNVDADALVGCDGIHSAVRAALYPREGPPIWSGMMIWRGATDWPVYEDGHAMVIAGGNSAKFVFYPIHGDPETPDRRLTNWAVMARVGQSGDAPPRREDWNRPGSVEDAVAVAREWFQFDFVDARAIIEATPMIYEYPSCDRDPLPRWSFGRTTLLGDAAHPMYPMGSNGASQSIVDARAVARWLSAGLTVTEALTAYDAERRPLVNSIVVQNRVGGPEGVIDLVEGRAPNGFDDLDAVATYTEREAVVRGYATLAGYATDQVNRR